MTLRETMARHALQTLTRLDHFGELVTYQFKSGAPDRQVQAVVNRLDVEPSAPNVPQVAKLRALVAIPVVPEASASGFGAGIEQLRGISTVVPGDKIILAMRIGAAPIVTRVKRIESQDEGLFVLEVES